MKKILYTILSATVLVFSACNKDLNQYPALQETSESVYSKPENYINVLAKCYASFVVAGQSKGGLADLDVFRGWEYTRCYFNLQEDGTDELAYTWLEGDLQANLTYLSWDANDQTVAAMYYHCYYTISVCNEFLKHCTDNAISGFSQDYQKAIRTYRAEARFLRALAYYHALDLFHNIPFADENTIGSSNLPERWTDTQIFNFIGKELRECSTSMLSTDSCATGRAPKAAAWMLLSRLYLNAPVYNAGAHNDSCMLYAQKVINEGGYALENNYGQLFNADNDKRVGKGHEIIFPFMFSNVSTVSWGGATYLICGEGDTGNSAVGDSVGCSSVWSMFRIRGEVPALFGANDARAMFITTGQTQYLDKGITDRTSGYFVVKWSNKTDANTVAVPNISADGAKTLFPVFRLADAYLMYAEAAARTNTNLSTALGYVNDLRSHRNAALVTESDLTATTNNIPYKFFLDERARELYWECVRRTDLIRFNCFTTNTYLWQWKGGVKEGKDVDTKYNIYPIPATEISANPNLYNTNY